MSGRYVAPPTARGAHRDLVRCAFQDWFGIARAQADLLVLLWEARRRFVPKSQLAADLGVIQPLRANALEVRVAVLRSAMAAEAVDYVPKRGFRLTEIGEAECHDALQEAARTIRGAARKTKPRPRRPIMGSGELV